jgi:MFS family permease
VTKLSAPIGREGVAYGAAGSAQGLGWGLGPILGAGLVALGGIPALYLACAGLMLLLLPVIMRSHTRAFARPRAVHVL